MIQIPEGFENLLKDAIGEESDALLDALESKPPVSIRIHPIKSSHDLDLMEQIPWCANGYYLSERIQFTLDPYFHAGHYYVQESSSMMIGEVIRQIELPTICKVLDLCAAPGGKSTLLCDVFGKNSLIHCHETIPSRAEVLRQNIQKWGYPNTVVTTGNPEKFIDTGLQYDFILVDAPCSGEGMFRKEPDALHQWNPQKVHRCHSLQKNILQTAVQLLAPGGYLLYSTCTFNELENEGSILTIMNSDEIENIQLSFHDDIHILHTFKNGIHCYRCLPSRMQGEGFSFILIRKSSTPQPPNKQSDKFQIQLEKQIPEPAISYLSNPENYHYFQKSTQYFAFPKSLFHYFDLIQRSKIPIIHAGIPLATLKGKDWVPHHALCMSIETKEQIPSLLFEKNQALDYLRGLISNDLENSKNINTKWLMVHFKDVTLGWIKLNEQIIKNYYPKELRIRNL
ncbi:MAG: hypothetical protein IPH93_05890 [Saprospiraceae bacterium]|nr:hypothetical protein [Saprospiraceae bacterium]